MITNYIKHLKFFILTPIFPILLGIILGTIIFIIYIIYFVPVYLCDDIIDLTDKLEFEIWKLEDNSLNICERKGIIADLDLVTSKNTNGGFIHRKVWSNILEELYNKEKLLLNNIHSLENSIKKLDPNFSTKLDATWQSKWGIMPKKN